MSVDFYLCCERHRECVHVGGNNASGRIYGPDGPLVTAFVIAHSGCSFTALTHEIGDEWDMDNAAGMLKKHGNTWASL